MIAGRFYIVCCHVLDRFHTLDIHVSGAGDEITLVSVFSGQLITDQMAAVI